MSERSAEALFPIQAEPSARIWGRHSVLGPRRISVAARRGSLLRLLGHARHAAVAWTPR